MEAKGKFDFAAVADDELNFRQGEILKIIHYDDIWCTAEINGEEGLVPRNFLDIHFPRWFQEDVTASDAEEFLMTRHAGEFMVRKCQTSLGNFCISIKHERGVVHYRLLRDKKGHYFLWLEKFTSLNKLVDFYKTNSISKSRIIYLNVNGFPDRGGPSKAQLTMPIFRVKALYDFSAIHKDELNFNEGDVIEVLDTSDVFWWKGRLNGFVGMFPASSTRRL